MVKTNTNEVRLLVSGFGDQVETLIFDRVSREVRTVARQTWGRAMSFLERAGENLYAVHEVQEGYRDVKDDGAVSRWRLASDGITWQLQEVSAPFVYA